MHSSASAVRKWARVLLFGACTSLAAAVADETRDLPVNMPAQGLPPPFATPAGAVMAIRDGGTKTLIDDLDDPYGLAFYDRWLYVAETTSVKRYPYDSKGMTVGPGEEVISLEGTDGGHITRTLLFDARHEYLYVSVGSGSNVDAGEPAIRAAINRYHPGGRGHEIYASGIRNAMGLGWNPVTGELWATSHERDGLGDDLPPDFLTRVRQGGF